MVVVFAVEIPDDSQRGEDATAREALGLLRHPRPGEVQGRVSVSFARGARLQEVTISTKRPSGCACAANR